MAAAISVLSLSLSDSLPPLSLLFNFIPQAFHNISQGFARLQARKAKGGRIVTSDLQKKFSKTWESTKEKTDHVFDGMKDMIEQTF